VKKYVRLPLNISSSLLLTAGLLGIYYAAPDWSPIAGKLPSEAARYATWISHLGCLYLFLQAAQYIVGRVGSSGEFWAETLASILPILALVWIFASQRTSTEYLSKWVWIVFEQAFVFALCDLVILGGVGAMINRLTDELHKQA
jgi:hypothetical protein